MSRQSKKLDKTAAVMRDCSGSMDHARHCHGTTETVSTIGHKQHPTADKLTADKIAPSAVPCRQCHGVALSNSPKKLLTPSETARALSISRTTLYELWKRDLASAPEYLTVAGRRYVAVETLDAWLRDQEARTSASRFPLPSTP